MTKSPLLCEAVFVLLTMTVYGILESIDKPENKRVTVILGISGRYS